MNWFSSHKEKRDQEVSHYLTLPFKPRSDQSLDDAKFCILDCEMTGTGRSSELVTLGAVELVNKRIKLNQVLDLRFNFSVDNESSEIHGEIRGVSYENTRLLINKLLSFIGNSILVGHNVSMDVAKINQLLKNHLNGLRLKNKIVDTFYLIQRIDPTRMERSIGGSGCRLDDLCNEFEIPIENRHTALGDAYLTAQVFMRELEILKKRKVKTVGALLR